MFNFVLSSEGHSFDLHYEYYYKPIKKIHFNASQKLTLEKAFKDNSDIPLHTIERIQIRDDQGRVIAYTPTRIKAIPLCLNKDVCWVFMWKTVYPWPAIFKFNTNSETWIYDKNPPLQYSRGGYFYQGFTEKFNLAFGTLGVILLLINKAWFFAVCVFFAFMMCFQIAKYRDLSKVKQEWIKRLLFFGYHAF